MFLKRLIRQYSTAADVRAIEKEIRKLNKQKNLMKSMSLYDELISIGGNPTQNTLSSLLYLCQIYRDTERGDVILKAMDNIKTDISLLTSKLNYYSVLGPETSMWGMYEQLVSKGYKLRLNSSIALLERAVKCKDLTRTLDLFSHIKSSKFKVPPDVANLVFETALNEGVWNEPIEQLLNIYKHNHQSMSKNTANLLIEWLKMQNKYCQVNEANIENGCCSKCGYKLESNKLNEKEHMILLKHSKLALQKEVSSFENSKIEEEEYWKFEKLLGTAGPFGAILDGQNISPLEASPKYLINLCQLMVNRTGLPALVISRAHLAHKIIKWVRLKDVLELTHHFNKHKIFFFFTRNRVADDCYFINSTLASGPQTYFVSNDSFGDHIHHTEAELIHLYQKWKRSSQVYFSVNKRSRNITFPKEYSTQLQWSDTHYHIPVSRESWICVRIK